MIEIHVDALGHSYTVDGEIVYVAHHGTSTAVPVSLEDAREMWQQSELAAMDVKVGTASPAHIWGNFVGK